MTRNDAAEREFVIIVAPESRAGLAPLLSAQQRRHRLARLLRSAVRAIAVSPALASPAPGAISHQQSGAMPRRNPTRPTGHDLGRGIRSGPEDCLAPASASARDHQLREANRRGQGARLNRARQARRLRGHDGRFPTAKLEAIRDIKALSTWVGGCKVYRAPGYELS